MWMSEAFALIAFSIRRLTRRTTGASNAMSRSDVRSSLPASSPRSSSPIVSMTFWTAVEPAPKYRSIASTIVVSVATARRTSIPSAPRRSSTTVGSVGFAQATTRTPSSTERGQKRYWRMYWGERRWRNGGVEGNSSRPT